MIRASLLLSVFALLIFNSCSHKAERINELSKEQEDSVVIAKFCNITDSSFPEKLYNIEDAPKNESIIIPAGKLYQGMTLEECIAKWGTPTFCLPYNECGSCRLKPHNFFFMMCIEMDFPLYVSKDYTHLLAGWNVNINQFRGLEIEFVVVGNQAYAFAAYYYTSWDDEKLWEYPCA